MGAYIFYCKKCRIAFSGPEGMKEQDLTCPECGTITVATNLPAEKWRAKTAAEKEILKQRFDEIKERQNVFASEGVNKTANAIKTGTIIFMVLSVLVSIILAAAIKFSVGAFVLIGCAVVGALFLGFAEIINLLQDIKNKMQ